MCRSAEIMKFIAQLLSGKGGHSNSFHVTLGEGI